MDVFYIIVSVTALVTLIVFLTYIGISMTYRKKATVENPYPPIKSSCPDYWSMYNGKCLIPNYGTRNTGGLTQSSASNVIGYNGQDNTIDFNDSRWATSGGTAICNQKKFANMAGITWDGVSNYNGCK